MFWLIWILCLFIYILESGFLISTRNSVGCWLKLCWLYESLNFWINLGRTSTMLNHSVHEHRISLHLIGWFLSSELTVLTMYILLNRLIFIFFPCCFVYSLGLFMYTICQQLDTVLFLPCYVFLFFPLFSLLHGLELLSTMLNRNN